MVASVGRITSGHGYDYLMDAVATSRHDYYTGAGEAPGVWAGSGRHALDLEGVIDRADMSALYGRFVDPRTKENCRRGPDGRPLGEVVLGEGLRTEDRVIGAGTAGERRLEQVAAFDVTFSPAKSVSVLWATITDPVARELIVEAHETAVDAGLAYLERNAGHARVGRGGVRRIDTEGFVVARFRHRTARSTAQGRVGDPQLHTHCAILNRVLCTDGKWRTLDGAAIFQHAHAAGARYAAVLEAELSRVLGVGWDTPDGKVPMREITGISADVRGRFSSRRAQIDEHYQQLEAEWRDVHGRSPTRTERAEMLDAATVRTRMAKRKGPDVDLHDQWRAALTSAEIAAVDAAVRQPQVATGGRVPVGGQLMRDRVFEALEQQRSWWTRAHLYAEVSRWADTIDAEAVAVEVERLAGESVTLTPDPDSDYRQPDRIKFSSRTILDAEHRVLTAATTLTGTEPVAAMAVEGLGDDQRDAVEAICGRRELVTTVIGPAGAGKTTMLTSVAASFEQAGRPITVLTLAATAAQVVTDETGLPAGTIASWKVGQIRIPHRGLVIVDEASMVPTITLDQLVRVAAAHDSRVVLIGDYAQMAAPEAGGLLHDLARHRDTAHLTNVRRFRHEWERAASRALRTQDPEIGRVYEQHDRIKGVTADNAADQLVAHWAADIDQGLASIIVVDTSEQAAHISAQCQTHLVASGHLGEIVATGRDQNPIRIGDIIQTRRNTSDQTTSDHHRVLNRDTWRVTGTTPAGDLRVAHTNSRRTATLTAGYVNEDAVLGYATTVAGAQGRTVDTGHVLVTPRTNHAALYVGMTRGRHTNTAHTVTDGHLHDEFGHGTLTPTAAFTAAVGRDSDSTRSATTIANTWNAGHDQRQQQRHLDRQHNDTIRWWTNHARQLPPHAQRVLTGRHHEILAILTPLTPQQRDHALRHAIRHLNWRNPDTANQFINKLRTPPPTNPRTPSGDRRVQPGRER